MIAPPRPSRFRPALTALVVCLAAGVLWRCAPALELPEDTHQFGQYDTCLVRQSDTCEDPDAGTCRTLPSESRPLLLGVDRESGEFLVARLGLPPIKGTLEGTHFRAEVVQALPDVCGCPAEVVETIEGELLATPVGEIFCTGLESDAGTCGEGEASDAGFTFSDAGLDYEKRYPALRGRVVNEVRAAADAGDCPCLPCRAEFLMVGRP